MADILGDGAIKVSWVTTISNTAAPTVAEMTAGVSLETYITPDGLDLQVSTDAVDASSIASNQYQEIPGRRRNGATLTLKDQGEANAPWTTFASRPSGYLVIRFNVASTTDWSAAQKVHVYPATAGDRLRMSPAANEMSKFQVPIFVTGTVQESVALS